MISAYDTGKLAPATIFNETLEFYEDEETIYVSTGKDNQLKKRTEKNKEKKTSSPDNVVDFK